MPLLFHRYALYCVVYLLNIKSFFFVLSEPWIVSISITCSIHILCTLTVWKTFDTNVTFRCTRHGTWISIRDVTGTKHHYSITVTSQQYRKCNENVQIPKIHFHSRSVNNLFSYRCWCAVHRYMLHLTDVHRLLCRLFIYLTWIDPNGKWNELKSVRI